MREEFKRRVIELIHGVPYKEALMKEWRADDSMLDNQCFKDIKKTYKGLPITIGRVMQATLNHEHNKNILEKH